MARGSSVDRSVVSDQAARSRAVTPLDSEGRCEASPFARPFLAVSCVPDVTLQAVVDWARSHRVPSLLCFTAVDSVRLFHQEAVGLMVLGEPPDAPTSDTLRALRGLNAQTPIVYVSADASDRRRASGPPPGANGFLVPPLTQLEVAQTLERLWPAPSASSDVLVVGPIRLQLSSRSLTVDGVPVHLPRKRFDLVAYLMKSADRVVAKEELALAVVGTLHGDPRRIPKELSAVRAALGRAAEMLETCKGGYRLNTAAHRH
jgi:DNA-binding response OmpR family regulator